MQRKYMRGLGNKMGEKPSEEMNKRLRALIRSRVCAVSGEALRDPIVACELGHLYNKEAVLLALLERTLNPAFAHIRGNEGPDSVPPHHQPQLDRRDGSGGRGQRSKCRQRSQGGEATMPALERL